MDNDEVVNDMREILSLVCKFLKKKVESGKLTAADVQAIRGILKDSGISAINMPGSPTQELAEAITKKVEAGEFPFAVNGPLLAPDDPAVKKAQA